METKELHYNYVYLNYNCDYGEGMIKEYNPDEFNAICLRDVEAMKGADVIPYPLYYAPVWVRKLYDKHMRRAWNHTIAYKLRRLWWPFVWRNRFKDKKPICFVFATWYYPLSYMMYLKKKYPNCKMVEVFRDMYQLRQICKPEMTEDISNKIYDLRMSYDPEECKKYGLIWFHQIHSNTALKQIDEYPQYDVFFCGRSKNRLQRIIKAYDVLSEAGLKCHFIITHAPETEQISREGIVYTNEYIPYLDMLSMSVKAKCIFDTQQDGSVGCSSRFLESLMYNKRLITDNPSVLTSSFYNPKYIHYVEEMEDIDPKFVMQQEPVDYHYDGEFSPIRLIEQIDSLLTAK